MSIMLLKYSLIFYKKILFLDTKITPVPTFNKRYCKGTRYLTID